MNSNSPSSACPDIGVWRAWLDRENEPMLLEEHLVDCPGCRRLVALLQEDVAQVRAAFAMLAPDEASLPSTADVAVARERLEWQRRRALPSLPRVGAQAPMALLLTRVSTPWRIAATTAPFRAPGRPPAGTAPRSFADPFSTSPPPRPARG